MTPLRSLGSSCIGSAEVNSPSPTAAVDAEDTSTSDGALHPASLHKFSGSSPHHSARQGVGQSVTSCAKAKSVLSFMRCRQHISLVLGVPVEAGRYCGSLALHRLQDSPNAVTVQLRRKT